MKFDEDYTTPTKEFFRPHLNIQIKPKYQESERENLISRTIRRERADNERETQYIQMSKEK